MVQDPRKFKYTSDYPQPLVVYQQQFEFVTVEGQSSYLFKVKHNLPYTPLALGKMSATENFTEATDMSQAYNSNRIISDSTYFYVQLSVSHSSYPKVYVRIIAFAPPDYSGEITIADNASRFRFNTDDNYLGLYKQGIMTSATGGIVNHDLGYIPQCRGWITFTAQVQGETVSGLWALPPEIYYNSFDNTTTRMSLATSTSYIGKSINDNYSLGQDEKIYYHIYTTEA